MSNTGYIIFYNYHNFKNYENILMSLIIGLHRSKKTICFSNGYAALKCGVSVATISRTIKKFVDEGYIKCIFLPERRIINFIKSPMNVEFEETCDIELGLEPTNTGEKTPNTPDETPLSQVLDPLLTTIDPLLTSRNNNIDYIIDNNTKHTTNEVLEEWKQDNRFCKIAGMFPETKLKNINRAFDYYWRFLPEKDKLEIERTLPTYIQRNDKNKNYIKQIDNYFECNFWITDETTLSLLRQKEPTKKKFIF